MTQQITDAPAEGSAPAVSEAGGGTEARAVTAEPSATATAGHAKSPVSAAKAAGAAPDPAAEPALTQAQRDMPMRAQLSAMLRDETMARNKRRAESQQRQTATKPKMGSKR